MEVISVKAARDHVMANYPNDPLLRHVVLTCLGQLPNLDIPDAVVVDPEAQDTELEKAIRQVRETYEKAQRSGYIRNKLGWALYQVWTKYE